MKKQSKTRKAPKIRKLTARYLEEVNGGLTPRIINPPSPAPACSQCTTFPGPK